MSESAITEKGHEYPVLDTGDNALTSPWKLGRCVKCGVEREAGGSKNECRGIARIRGALRRGLTLRDGGFIYDRAFGCDRDQTSIYQHVLVRVELRVVEETGAERFAFRVFVDFHFPVGADVESAEHFRKATNSAVRKARWAHELVDGLTWHRSEIMKKR